MMTGLLALWLAFTPAHAAPQGVVIETSRPPPTVLIETSRPTPSLLVRDPNAWMAWWRAWLTEWLGE
jgi:hypothetical protein